MKQALKLFALAAAIIAPVAGIAAYDRSETTIEYRTGTVFMTGESAVWEYENGRLFKDDRGELVGYYGGGNPGVVAFGCEGAKGPMIAMEESDLPRCKRVEPIANRRMDWAR